jgi:hypothetical protein
MLELINLKIKKDEKQNLLLDYQNWRENQCR